MGDTRDLKSLAQWGVRVRAPLPVPLYLENQMYKVYTYKDGKYDFLGWSSGNSQKEALTNWRKDNQKKAKIIKETSLMKLVALPETGGI